MASQERAKCWPLYRAQAANRWPLALRLCALRLWGDAWVLNVINLVAMLMLMCMSVPGIFVDFLERVRRARSAARRGRRVGGVSDCCSGSWSV